MGNIITQMYNKITSLYYKNNNEELTEFLINKNELKEFILDANIQQPQNNLKYNDKISYFFI